MTQPLFLYLDSEPLAHEIVKSERSVCYAAPGIHREPADELAALARNIGPELITVCIDFDERVMRMGFDTLEAVKTLREAGIEVRSASGLRTGLAIIDDKGYIFTPTALPRSRKSHRCRAERDALSKEQITEALSRLSPAAKTFAIAFAKSDEERIRIRDQAIEVPSGKIENSEVAALEKQLEVAPPVKFDVARRVRVFSAYLQYVELKLSTSTKAGSRFRSRGTGIAPASRRAS